MILLFKMYKKVKIYSVGVFYLNLAILVSSMFRAFLKFTIKFQKFWVGNVDLSIFQCFTYNLDT